MQRASKPSRTGIAEIDMRAMIAMSDCRLNNVALFKLAGITVDTFGRR